MGKKATEGFRVGEKAGSLGAAAATAVGAGLWKDFAPLIKINEIKGRMVPNAKRVAGYKKILGVFKEIGVK